MIDIEEFIYGLGFNDVMEIITLLLAIIGGFFALVQWRKSNIYKRGEIVHDLIKIVRDDKDISTVMDIIDWDKGLVYCGTFYLTDDAELKIGDDDLIKIIDRTLSHFSFICYLRKQHTLTQKDMRVFDYEIRRLIDNKNISNYLYSLYHWSKYLNVSMSFSFLVDYCIKKEYLYRSFKSLYSPHYEMCLSLPDIEKEESK